MRTHLERNLSASILALTIILVAVALPALSIDCQLECETGPAEPMPVPTGYSTPGIAYFEEPFLTSWDHVWTGCGGYEFEYRRVGSGDWHTIKVGSGSSAEIVIRMPDDPIETPANYELRVRSYWGVGCDERVYSEYSTINSIQLECGWLHCETGPQDPMPVPTSFATPLEACFEEPFDANWSHVWTGCGGYEFQYSLSGQDDWTTVKVGSGSSADIVIRRPDGQITNPTSYDLRVRSFWGVGCDDRETSAFCPTTTIDMYCSEPTLTQRITWSCIKAEY